MRRRRWPRYTATGGCAPSTRRNVGRPRSNRSSAASRASRPSTGRAPPARCRRTAAPAGRRTPCTPAPATDRRRTPTPSCRSARRSAAPRTRRTSSSSGTRISTTTSGAPSSRPSSASAWVTVRGNPSSTQPPAASGSVSRSRTSADDHVVADQRAPGHGLLDQVAEAAARRHRVAQHVAGRDLRHAVISGDPRRLRALARTGRPQHQQPQRHAPSVAPATNPCLLHEPVVVPHDQLRLDLAARCPSPRRPRSAARCRRRRSSRPGRW